MQQMSSLFFSIELSGPEVADGAIILGLDDSSSVSEQWVNYCISVCDRSRLLKWRSYLKDSRSCIHFLHRQVVVEGLDE